MGRAGALEMCSPAHYYSYFNVILDRTTHNPRSEVSSTIAIFLVALLLAVSVTMPFRSGSASTAALPAEGPEAAIAMTRRDFGQVFVGEELEQNFAIRNTGTKPLELRRKSMLSARPADSRPAVAAAVWRSQLHYAARPVAAMRAAPT